ncbi:type IV toxin-antitoxin system AbiEi family antitoxin domain-containing protein [Pseudarthrobacter sp. S9]|uniref:type IV toxin-antitoxin system AbiEi family antitoxin domain-containing protein n=1 Tax=Pseudarthrobacter sp. S9 TaxID=3418421 RepID=UPI003CFD0E26
MKRADADAEDPLAAVWAESAGPRLPAGTSAPSAAVVLSPASLPAILPASGNIWRTEELLDRGISARQIRRLSDAGTLLKLRRGCYVRTIFWASLDKDSSSRTRIDAYAHRTLISSNGSYVFSHTSAARLHGLYLWQVDDRIHLTVPFLPSSGGHAGDVVAHTRALPALDVVQLQGYRVTSLERTAVDCCLVLNYRQGLILMDHALRLGAGREELERQCAQLRGASGVGNLRKVLTHSDARSESPGETLTRDLIRRLQLPTPELQFEVRTRLGLFRLDCAWPERLVALEFDGRRKYFEYAPTAEAVFQERRREKALVELGWRVVRIEWRDLFREREFKTRLLEVLKP